MVARHQLRFIDADDEANEVIPFRYSITSYGADFPVDGLVQRIEKGDVYIPEFQRGYVWKVPQASRFIESLLLGLPVPAIFLSRERVSKKLLVIDGRQRLTALQLFYANKLVLNGVQPSFENRSYDSLTEEDQRQLNDALIHAVIVQQDVPSDDDSSIYHIFERLNSGGVRLEPQEIRACIYHGEFATLLKELNQHEHWRKVFGPENLRMKDCELILRFFALYYESDQYSENMTMKEFLNRFMSRNKDLSRISAKALTTLFCTTMVVIHDSLGRRAFRPKRGVNAAFAEAIMVGVAKRLMKGSIDNLDDVRTRFDALLDDEQFQDSTETGTSHQENVAKRIALATAAFADVR